ncbi:tRNA (cytidine/uridine-2'-O-)-methyltransferase TrmJ [Pycnococcus provasolii]
MSKSQCECCCVHARRGGGNGVNVKGVSVSSSSTSSSTRAAGAVAAAVVAARRRRGAVRGARRRGDVASSSSSSSSFPSSSSSRSAVDDDDDDGKLHDCAVVLVAPRFAGSIGSVARSCAAFDVPEMRIVNTKCKDHTCRKARGAAAGAQGLLMNANMYDTLEDALGDHDDGLCFVVPGSDAANACQSMHSSPRSAYTKWKKQTNKQNQNRRKLCLVFGAENTGLSEEDAAKCRYGGAQINHSANIESLSLPHAVSVALWDMYRPDDDHM